MSGVILYDLEGEGTLVLADATEHFSLLADTGESSVGDLPKSAGRVADTASSTESLLAKVSSLSVWPKGAGAPVQALHQVVVPHGKPVLSALSESGHTLVRYDFCATQQRRGWKMRRRTAAAQMLRFQSS